MLTVKRIIDLTIAYISIVFFSPLFFFVAIMIYCAMGRPVIFRQQRAGKNSKAFDVYRFRTMTNDRDSKGKMLPDDERLTKIGRLLRATSLDEIPQLINIIKGEMSVVGPRPLPVEYLSRYTKRQALRNKMNPGITGWVAVNYRGKEKQWDEKFNQDAWYVENWSIGLDLKIIALTFLIMLRRFKINRKGETTSSEFTGNITQ